MFIEFITSPVRAQCMQLFDEQIRNTIKKQYKFEADDVLMTIIGTCHKHNK